MATASPHVLAARIAGLPSDRIAEIEDFIDFIGQREADRTLRRAATMASVPAFSVIWDNPEDDVYDDL